MSIRIEYQEYSAFNAEPTIQVTNGEYNAATGIAQSSGPSGTNYNSTYDGYVFSRPLKITYTFPNAGQARGFTIGFRGGGYCTCIKVTTSLSTSPGGITQQGEIRPTGGAIKYYPMPVGITSYKFITCTLEFIAWSAAGTPAIIYPVRVGKTTFFTGDDLTAAPTITQEVNPVGMELPYSTSEFTLFIEEDAPQFKRWNKISIFHNGKRVAQHYIDEVKRDGNLYAVKGLDVIGVLDSMHYDGRYFNSATQRDLTLPSCINAAITNDDSDAGAITSLAIDDSYQGVELSGFIPQCTRREALHRIIQAVNESLTVDENGYLDLTPFEAYENNTGTEIDNSSVFEGSSFDFPAPYTSGQYSKYSLVPETNAESDTLFDETLEVGTHRIHFDNPVRIAMLSVGSGAAASFARFSYGGTTVSPYEYDTWVDVDVTSAGRVILFGIKYKFDEKTYTVTYNSDVTIATNELRVSGNMMESGGTASASRDGIGRYYRYIDCAWTGKLIADAAFGENGVRMGGLYSLTIPGKGSIKGWLTKAVTTMSENYLYVTATITGKFEEAT